MTLEEQADHMRGLLYELLTAAEKSHGITPEAALDALLMVVCEFGASSTLEPEEFIELVTASMRRRFEHAQKDAS